MALAVMRNCLTLGMLVAAALSLGGCQGSCTGDPRFDNYWCARSNLSSGTYARQTAHLRQVASDRQLELEALRSRLAAQRAALADAQARNASTEVQQLQAEIASLRQQIAALQR